MKKINTLFLICLSFFMLNTLTYARNEKSLTNSNVEEYQKVARLVTGLITDESGEGLPGVSIYVPGTALGTTTNIDGSFSFEVPINTTILEVSYIGMKDEKIELSSKKEYELVLLAENIGLDEVIVLGYGVNARKQDLSAAIGVLSNTEDLNVRPVTSTENLLQGQLAGVTVQSNGGDPTSKPSLIIRGQGSQNGDNVLWVIDGVPGAPIASMSDIASIVVLKDAASAAIYGAQSGAGGVVLVTTKKAKEGVVTLSYDGVFGLREAVNLPTPLTAEQQVEMRKISYSNAGMSLPDGWDTSKNPWVETTRTDWMDEIFRTAFYQRHNLALNGGSESLKNRLSFSFVDNQGVLENTFNKDLSIRYNGTFNLNKWISISEDLVWKTNENHSVNTDSGYSGAILSAIYMPSSATVYNPLDGTFGGVTTEDPDYILKYGSNFAGAHGDAINPVRELTARNIFNKSSDIWTTTTLKIKNIVAGLNFTSRFSYNLATNHYKDFNPKRDEPGKPDLSNNLRFNTYRSDTWKTENTLTYDRSFDQHNFGFLLSTTADHFEERKLETEGKNFSDESEYLQYLRYAGSISANDFLIGPDSNVSLVGRLSYSYDNRYFMTASWRRDYAGRLPKDNNYGDFPAATFAWKLSNENFFPKQSSINLLKLRASWGRVGNLGSIGYNYKSLLLGSSFWAEQAIYGVATNEMYKNFVYNNKVLNPDLTWETSEQVDLGLDVAIFDNKLNFSFDYFNKKTFDLIQYQTINWPDMIGLDPMLINQGEVKNEGFEIEASWNDKMGEDFSYFIKGNFSYLKNWVSDIGVKNEDGGSGVWTGGKHFRNLPYVYQTAEGEPLGSFYLIETDGLFKSDMEAESYVDKNGNRIQPNAVAGDLKFVDFNEDGVISDGDRQYMGSSTPKTTYAFTLGATYKKLSLSCMFQGVEGSKIFHIAKFMTLSDVEGSFNRDSEILNAWSPSNLSSNIPRISKNDPNSNFGTASDWYLEDGSYIRLKNLTLSYDLSDILQKWEHTKKRNSSLSVYFSGENLLTFTNYSGMDPETGGWDALKYPVSRVYSFGLKLTY